MPQIVANYDGQYERYPYTWGSAYHNFKFEALGRKTQEKYDVVKIDYYVTTYRISGADQHPSLFSTNEDKHISSFQGSKIAHFSFYTSTKPTAGYISGFLTDFTTSELEFMFKRPGTKYVQSTAGTTDPVEMAANIQALEAISIDPDTLDDTV